MRKEGKIVKEIHTFSDRYIKRKEAVLSALLREEREKASKGRTNFTGAPARILICAAVIAVLSASAFAVSRFIEFRMNLDRNEVTVQAGTTDTKKENDERPLRSWRSDEGEISVHLNITGLPSDMHEKMFTNGKYESSDPSRRLTISGIDLRRSDLNEIIKGATGTRAINSGGKTVYVIEKGEADFYDRLAYMVFEEEELILKFYVSWGISDDELGSLAESIKIEYTADALSAIPIENEIRTGSADRITFETGYKPIAEADLRKTGEPVRDINGRFTLTVDDVSIYDDIRILDPGGILNQDYVRNFTDENGDLIPYNRTELISAGESGETQPAQFGETVQVSKKLFVITLTVSDIDLDDFSESDRYDQLCAYVYSFTLNGFTIINGRADITTQSSVIEHSPGVRSSFSEPVYREDLGNGQWRIAYLIDEDVASGDLVLRGMTSSGINIKIH